MNNIKTIDVQAKEWFDRLNGNSYFSAIATINFGMEDQKVINVPFQYGYGDSYIHASFEQLQKDGILNDNITIYAPWRYCEANNIILRHNKKEKCLKSEVKNFSY